MSLENFKDLEAEACKNALTFRAQLEESAPHDLTVDVVDRAQANGTNSLDKAFLASLLKGAHLNDEFLAV
jgi:hypothetical protein